MKDQHSHSADVAVNIIRPGDRVFIYGSAATPLHIAEALQKPYAELSKVELVVLLY